LLEAINKAHNALRRYSNGRREHCFRAQRISELLSAARSDSCESTWH
jgi:hypothetical protein